MTRQELKESFIEDLKQKKTIRSKKILVNKWIKETNEQIKDIKEILRCSISQRYLHGKYITYIDLREAEQDLEMFQQLIIDGYTS